MSQAYKNEIRALCQGSPLNVNLNTRAEGLVPTNASSEFLTNKAQGDWAESIVLGAINSENLEYVAVPYGRADDINAGEPGFEEFYISYQNELNTIGKKPDLLIFRRDYYQQGMDLSDRAIVSNAVAALEVRSSSFKINGYNQYMQDRSRQNLDHAMTLKNELLNSTGDFLRTNAPRIHEGLTRITDQNINEFKFLASGAWTKLPESAPVIAKLKELREVIEVLNKRDFLSFTPKVEDLALVNRWIDQFAVRHFYAQVFFDKAFILPFKSVLQISNNPENLGRIFHVEKDTKNQGKTTIKINVNAGRELISRIEGPQSQSNCKELGRGRQLYYVTFQGGRGYLNRETFMNEVINGN